MKGVAEKLRESIITIDKTNERIKKSIKTLDRIFYFYLGFVACAIVVAVILYIARMMI